MKITVAGAGNVGLVTAACLAELGHQVISIDIQKEKIDMIKKGETPFFEPGLDDLIEKNISYDRLHFTTDPTYAYGNAEMIFIAVGTPEKRDGSADLSYLHAVCFTIAAHLKSDVIICTKSTVPVGTNDTIKEIINKYKPSHLKTRVVANPEFLREGSAIFDFFLGDRIVVGTENTEALAIMKQLYLPLKIPIIHTDIRSAEMIKYASNAFLATKISFINEIASICEKVGANIDEVAYGIGKDKRIGESFLQAGIGYGGSCFPKDTKALVQLAGNVQNPFELLESVIEVNNRQHSLIVTKAKETIGSLWRKKVALLGLSYKPETDDIREAPSLTIIKELLQAGATVTAYDPVAIPNAKQVFGNTISYTSDIQRALLDADFAIIATEWEQIKHLPMDMYTILMKNAIVLDGRNCYELNDIQKFPITYISIGRPAIIHKAKYERNAFKSL